MLKKIVAGFAAAILLVSGSVPAQTDSSCKPPHCLPDSIRTIGLIVLDYSAFYLTAGGIHEYNGILSDSGQAKLVQSITKSLSKKGFQVRVFPKEEKDTALLGIQALYGAVKYSADAHVFGEGAHFSTREKQFDYSLGPVKDQVARYGVDALLYVFGLDETRTHMRRVVAGEAQAGAIAGAVASAVMSAFLGFSLGGGGITLRKDYTIVSAGCIDKNGSLCWYNKLTKVGNYNLTDPEEADEIVDKLLTDIHPRNVRP